MEHVREDYLLGNKKIIVGDNLHDLVLENLGRIYIRYGNSYKEFNSIINSIGKASNSAGFLVITDSIQEASAYKDGILVFDTKSFTLYLVHSGELLTLAEHINENSSRYVRKTGDTMTGQLVIDTKEAPLLVRSAELVKNLNSEFLGGYRAKEFAKVNVDETIGGSWTFNGDNTFNGQNEFNRQTNFKDTAVFGADKGNAAIMINNGDLVTNGSMGSSQFASGMNGYGWRLDANTNTLEIDNLVVRGILNVFELVVNKVSATNGSLWVTDSFKIEAIHNLEYLDCSKPIEYNRLSVDTYYIPYMFDYNPWNEGDDSRNPLEESKIGNVYGIIPNINEGSLASRSQTDSIPPSMPTPTFYKFNYLFKIVNKQKFVEIMSGESRGVLANSDFISGLMTEGIVDKTNLFQKDAKNVNDLEKITNEDGNVTYIPAIDPLFDKQYYTVVPTMHVDFDGCFNKDNLSRINLYYKYFGEEAFTSNGTLQAKNIYIVESKSDEYPVFKPGDIIRCQKFTGNSVQQYNAIVLGLIGAYGFIMQLQNKSSKLEITAYSYDQDGNLQQPTVDENGNIIHSEAGVQDDETFYTRSQAVEKLQSEGYNIFQDANSISDFESEEAWYQAMEAFAKEYVNQHIEELTKGQPQLGDALVRIGSIFIGDRQNSLMMTSSSDNSPYQDVLVGVNRPDYTVNYFTPKYRKFEAYYEYNGVIRKGVFYLQNNEFKAIMIAGDIINAGFDWESVPNEYKEILGSWNDAYQLIYQKYKPYTTKVEIPKSQTDGSNDLGGLTKIVDVALTYQINDDDPVYFNNEGERIMVKVTEESGIENKYFISSNPNTKVISTFKTECKPFMEYKKSDSESAVTLTLGRLV